MNSDSRLTLEDWVQLVLQRAGRVSLRGLKKQLGRLAGEMGRPKPSYTDGLLIACLTKLALHHGKWWFLSK